MPTSSHLDLLQNTYIPCYQPIIDVATGKVAGYESLARQLTANNGLVSAGSLFFDPVVPKQIKLNIDRELREQAIAYFARQLDREFLALNISPDWLDLLERHAGIPTIEMIQRAGIDPARVIIEFTESSGELEKLKRLTDHYHNAGLRLAIDDFGVGGSQVDRIIALQPDFIKLDMDLFKRASKGGPEADVVLSIAAIAQRAGCQIICEGVETEPEFHFAMECGAEYIQGWLFQGAKEHTVLSDTFANDINQLKAGYLQRKSQRHVESADHNRQVANQVRILCDLFVEQVEAFSLSSYINYPNLAALGIQRLYICDLSGKQLSPNYEISAQGVSVNDFPRGYNWSHRPYFPLLHAMHGMQVDHVIVSDPYKDAVRGTMCKTLGAFIAGDRVLLIDVQSREDVLFQSEPGTGRTR